MKEKKSYSSFEIVERVVIKTENEGELEILLKRNDVRVFRIEFYLNGVLLKPIPLTGKNKAISYWGELMGKLRKTDSFKLTPENADKSDLR